MGKQDFYFHQDLLVKVWQRQVFTIEAETIEEARAQAKKYTQFDVGIHLLDNVSIHLSLDFLIYGRKFLQVAVDYT